MATHDHPRVREWRHRLLLTTGGLLVFETLTGLSIWLLPFSVTNQILVLLHTAGGLLFVGPYFWYQVRHWRIYWSMPMNHVKLTGYFSMVAVLVVLVTGVVLTWQALFGTRIIYGWSLAHLLSTFALIAAVLPHVLTIVLRAVRARKPAIQPILDAQKWFGSAVAYVTVALFAVAFLWAYAYEDPFSLYHDLPEDYHFVYGEDRPFAPSLAQTIDGRAIDARALGGSESCRRCHEQIYEEWEPSAHRYAAMSPLFRSIQAVMGEQNSAESTRYCGGCHDPISLFSGTKNLFRDDLTNPIGFDEGVSCIVCHAIQETDVMGNAAYTITAPERYMYELHEGRTSELISDFLIRAYPNQHVESLQHRLFRTPEFCAACHKQFIDEEINNVGWVQLQNQYDNWRQSRWNHEGDPRRTVECRECHMPLVDSYDPARGDALDYNRSPHDEKHRSHRFLGANQHTPLWLELPGAEEHVRLTEEWLRGDFDIPEIAHKWLDGPVAPVELIVPEYAVPGEEVVLHAVVTNNKAGHDFPTGPLDIIQAWIEVTVTDQDGRVVFTAGTRDEHEYVEPGTFMFKAEPVDEYGNLINRHNLWEMVGVRYRRSLFPGFSDRAEFAFVVPGGDLPEGDVVPGEKTQHQLHTLHGRDIPPGWESISFPAPEVKSLHVKARLLYRKVDQMLLDDLYGPESGITSPITVMSTDEQVIPVAWQRPASTPGASYHRAPGASSDPAPGASYHRAPGASYHPAPGGPLHPEQSR